MTNKTRRAYINALTTAAAMIETLGEEGTDHGSDIYTHDEFTKQCQKVATKLYNMASKQTKLLNNDFLN